MSPRINFVHFVVETNKISHTVSFSFIACDLARFACATLKPPLKISMPNNIVEIIQVTSVMAATMAAVRAEAQTEPLQ
jgi:hypothetical protein